MGLKTLSATGEIDHYKINIRSISNQYKITSFNQLHIPPKMFVDLNFTIINLTNNKYRDNVDQSDQHPI